MAIAQVASVSKLRQASMATSPVARPGMAISGRTTAKMSASSSRAAATTKGVVARQPVMSASVYKSMAGAGVTRSGAGVGVGVRRGVVVPARREVGGGDDLCLFLGGRMWWRRILGLMFDFWREARGV